MTYTRETLVPYIAIGPEGKFRSLGFCSRFVRVMRFEYVNEIRDNVRVEFFNRLLEY